MIKGSHAASVYPFTSFSSLLLTPNAGVDDIFLRYVTFLYKTEKSEHYMCAKTFFVILFHGQNVSQLNIYSLF